MATLGYLMARLMSALALSLKANGLLDEDPFPPLGGHCHSSLAKVFKLFPSTVIICLMYFCPPPFIDRKPGRERAGAAYLP